MRNLDLEAQIAHAPDDAGPYVVYADWLTERGDPRGELIAVELGLEAEPHKSTLQRRRTQLHEQHGALWVGPLRVSNRVTVEWRRGFIDKVVFGDTHSRRRDPQPAHDELYAALRALPAAALVREIVFGHVDADAAPSWNRCAAALVRDGVPASLRVLGFEHGTVWSPSETRLDGLPDVYPRLAGLTALRISLGHVDLGDTMALPSLRDLRIATHALTARHVTAIASADWPVLETLVLQLSRSAAPACDASDLRALLAADLPRLRHLAIHEARFADELVPAIAALAPQLATLSLGFGGLTDRGGRLILEHAAAFRHLDALDLVETRLSPDLAAALVAAIPNTYA